ncbi:hypothetical protein B296_00021818 [Ensete ventricosum]|uniref:AT-hook motif nuclear-localized protein n=1 Tax=Ensete ventricosum TaxID=4639 RepID=A0A426ZY77_ENSVE|nr:hypothetical protein B296_00021818 [Ensete ventricosum]
MEGSEGGAPSPTVAVTVTAAADATGSHQPPSAALAAAVVREEKPASEISGMAAEPIKKRGRPRKYGPDGCLLRPLNPMSISASVPAGVRMPSTSRILFSFLNCIDAGEMEASSAGTNFTPHVITVASGEGRFELLSLSGSFMPTENGGTGSRSGGLSVSLASPDGRVVGGGVAGLLVAASPVQVVVGSFLPSYQMEQKIKKKPRLEAGSASTPPSTIPSSSADAEEAFGSGQGQHDQAATGKLDPSTTSPFGEESWAAALRSVPADFNMSLPGG